MQPTGLPQEHLTQLGFRLEVCTPSCQQVAGQIPGLVPHLSGPPRSPDEALGDPALGDPGSAILSLVGLFMLTDIFDYY